MGRTYKNKIIFLYQDLRKQYGRPRGQWSFWCKRPKTAKEKEQVIIEAILTQRTNWRNVGLAMANLKKARLDSLKKIAKISGERKTRLVSLMRPSGFYKQKTEYLIGLARFIVENYGNISRLQKEPKEKLRKELLSLKGIGPETADSILLYALEKPVFVIDEYTKQLLKRKRIVPLRRINSPHNKQSAKYEDLRKLFEQSLPRDWRLYQDFHALVVIDGKVK